jgi:hypothetical protein
MKACSKLRHLLEYGLLGKLLLLDSLPLLTAIFFPFTKYQIIHYNNNKSIHAYHFQLAFLGSAAGRTVYNFMPFTRRRCKRSTKKKIKIFTLVHAISDTEKVPTFIVYLLYKPFGNDVLTTRDHW